MKIAWLYKDYEDSSWSFSDDEPGDWVFIKKQIVYTEIYE